MIIPFFVSFALLVLLAILFNSMGGDIGELYSGAFSFANGMMGSGGMGQIMMFILIVYGGQMVAKEYSLGTIKFLLTRSYSRWEILLAKYIALLLFGLLLLLFTVVAAIIVGYIFFGHDSTFVVEYVKNDEMLKESVFSLLAKNSLFSFIEMTSYATLAFMISVFVKSGAIAVGVPIFLALFGTTAIMLLSQYSWAKYLLFANTSLYSYLAGGEPMIEGMTLPFSLGILAVYYIAFLAASFVGFMKKDIF